MCGQFAGLRGRLPLPPSADYAESDQGEQKRRGLGDLLNTSAANDGCYELVNVEVGYLDVALSASPRQ